MIRTQICLTVNEKIDLQKDANERGLSMSELLRRIVDKYLIGNTKS